MNSVQTAIIKLLKKWQSDLSENPPELLLFGSSIYSDADYFHSRSDLDLLALIPEEKSAAISRWEWIIELKRSKTQLEKEALFALKKDNSKEQIVSSSSPHIY